MKIAFGLLNQLNHKSVSYQEHIRNITLFVLNTALSQTRDESTETILIEGNDITEIMLRAVNQEADHLFLVAMGYQSHSHTLVYQIIKEAEENNYSFVGHILEDKPNGYFYLHDQALYVNLNTWKKIDCPEFGNWRTVVGEVLAMPNRSIEDIHDDYTPTYLKPTDKTQSFNGRLRPGATFISDILSAGYDVGNFSRQVRDQKYHLYPDIEDTRFERILNGELDITVESVGPTGGQNRYLSETNFDLNVTNLVFVFNNDPVSLPKISYDKNTKLDTLYAVAAGFKPIQVLVETNWSSSRIVYIDYSQPALNFKKWLVETWDGKNYLEKINEYKQLNPSFRPNWLPNKDFSPEWDKTIELFGGEESWLNIWNQYKQLPHRYIHTDFFKNYNEMLEDMDLHAGNNFIWFSNSFYTPASLRNFSPSVLKSLYETFLKSLIEHNKSIHLGGSNFNGESAWIHYGEIQ